MLFRVRTGLTVLRSRVLAAAGQVRGRTDYTTPRTGVCSVESLIVTIGH